MMIIKYKIKPLHIILPKTRAYVYVKYYGRQIKNGCIF